MIPAVVDAGWLSEHPDAVLVDVRWFGPAADRSGLEAYLSGHLPGAVYLDLEEALAAEASAEGGRHPLPEPSVFAAAMGEAGIGDGATVVAYDSAGGAFAARLVWMLRLLGEDAALLDGGLKGWDGERETGSVKPRAASFSTRPWDPGAFATIDDATAGPLVVDSRDAGRYRGDSEPVDARAGHVPGAINLPFGENLGDDGHFLAPDALRARFEEAGITDAADAVVYCGSGVTACHNLIALEYAGLGRARLYPGSWSQYAATDRPVATGDAPGSRPVVDHTGSLH